MSRLSTLKLVLLIFGICLFPALPAQAADPGCTTVNLSPAAMPDGVVGTNYNQALTASGGTAPYTFTLIAGALPNGLSLSPAGVVSGTPTASGGFNFTIRAADINNANCLRSYTVTICTVTLSPASASIGATGGSGTITVTSSSAWTVTTSAFIIANPTNGVGTAVVNYSVAANPNPSPRFGTISIGGCTFFVQQGAQGIIISENFDNGIPANWKVVDGGTGSAAGSAWTTANPCGRSGIGLNPPFAIIDPTCAGAGTIPDDELRLPEFDATGLGRIILQIESRFRLFMGSGQTLDADVSTNGGASWTNVLQITADEPLTTRNIDITAAIAPNPSRVLIRFHYHLPSCGICTRPDGSKDGLSNSKQKPAEKSSPAQEQESYVIFERINALFIKLDPAAVSRPQGTAIPNLPIANVSAFSQVMSTLVPTVNGGSGATVNGVEVSNLLLNTATGELTANVTAGCLASTASFTLGVTNGGAIMATAPLTVTVTGNTPPALGDYPTTTVALNGGTTVTPSAPPSDGNGIASLIASAPGFTGTFSGNTTTGAITISNAAPAGTYTVTATVRDNCLAITARTFTLGVGAQTITVSTTADTIAADGFCSLREAIQAANTNLAVNECNAGAAGLDNIVFTLGGGTPAINVTSAMPAITQPVNINGNTGGSTRVELNGAGAGASAVGLVITAGNSTVRSLVINRFGESGIAIGSLGGNVIENCYLGTNAAGTADLGNGRDGVRINGAPNNMIGGTTAAARNLISGNSEYGVLIFNAGATGNLVQGNYIGTDVTGLLALGNGLNGVRVNGAANNLIGGAAAGARNVISGNAFDGVFLLNSTATGNLVQNNIIGLTANGASALPNLRDGVQINGASNNTIGGTSANLGNLIFSSTGAGVLVTNAFGTGTGNAIQGNSISANQGIGIDITPGSGVTANDAGDGDAGPNNLQNFPVLTSVTSNGAITGSFDSTTANSAYPVQIEFFANASCDASGNGEGEVFLGSTTLAAPGNFAFGITPVVGKPFITATATDSGGNTSEFSACRKVNIIPAITASAPLTRQQSSAAINSQIATVADPDQALNTLVVTAIPLTGSGVTISNIAVNGAGNVTANVAASCGATSSTFMLNVADNLPEINTATLIVNVTANSAPTLTFAAATVNAGASTTNSPAAATDNGSITGYMVQSQGTYTGTISVNASGVVSVSNAKPGGAHTITIRVTDNCGATTDASFTLTVSCQTIVVTPAIASLPDGQITQPYSQQLAQTGGFGVITWSISAGSLPGGITLNPASGLVSGTPAASGTFNFTARATDGNVCMGTRNYALFISSCLPITITPTSLPATTTFTSYSQQLAATGGSPAYTFTTSAGTLPAGLNLSAGGFLSGAPTVAGNFSFTVRATDVNNCFGEQPYALIITANPGLMFYPLPRPIRLFDTRSPIPGFPACAYLNQPLQGDVEFVRQARITCDGITIPATAKAIVGNATIANPQGGGFAILFPDGQPRPTASNINFAPGQVIANSFTVGLDDDGEFRVYPFVTTDFIVDITGYFAPPTTEGLYYHALPRPIRLFDSRAPIPNFPACAYLSQPLQGNVEFLRQARITCDGITIPNDAQVIAGNSTVVAPVAGGFATLFPNGQPRPNASNINYAAGVVIANAFTVSLGGDGQFRIYPFTTTDFVVDITGYYSSSAADANGAGLLYEPLPRPIRLFDTRAPIPGFPACAYLSQPLQGGVEFVRQARITCDGITVPEAAKAITGNSTVVTPVAGGFATLFPNGEPRPNASNINYAAGQVIANAFTLRLGDDGQFRVYPFTTTDFVVDITGYFAP